MPEEQKQLILSPNQNQICPASPGENGRFDTIGDSVNSRTADLIQKELENFPISAFNSPGFDLKIPTSNATEAIFKYLEKNYKSFTFNKDFSYTSLDLKDAKDFIRNIDQAYGEIADLCSDKTSLNATLADFLGGNQLSVLPTNKMLKYYKTKNFFTGGIFAAQGFSSAATAKTLPVAARSAYLLGGFKIVTTSFVLGSAFSILEDLTPWRYGKITFNALKWTSLLPARGAEAIINGVLAPIESKFCGISLPSNATKALISGPGLTLRDINETEVRAVLETALRKYSESMDKN